MDPRTAPTTTTIATTATVPPTAVPADDRPEAHNSGVDEKLAETVACGQVHLPTGRTCVLEHRHQGACDFVPRPQVQAAVAEHRTADG